MIRAADRAKLSGMSSDEKETSLSATERKITIDALLTYGLSIAGLIQSQRFPAASPQHAKLLEVLHHTTTLLKRLGGQVPAEMQATPPPVPETRQVH